MIFVVVEELIPDSGANSNTDVTAFRSHGKAVLMMVLNVALG